MCRYVCVCTETDRRALAWTIDYAAVIMCLLFFGEVVAGTINSIVGGVIGSRKNYALNRGSFVSIYLHGCGELASGLTSPARLVGT